MTYLRSLSCLSLACSLLWAASVEWNPWDAPVGTSGVRRLVLESSAFLDQDAKKYGPELIGSWTTQRGNFDVNLRLDLGDYKMDTFKQGQLILSEEGSYRVNRLQADKATTISLKRGPVWKEYGSGLRAVFTPKGDPTGKLSGTLKWLLKSQGLGSLGDTKSFTAHLRIAGNKALLLSDHDNPNRAFLDLVPADNSTSEATVSLDPPQEAAKSGPQQSQSSGNLDEVTAKWLPEFLGTWRLQGNPLRVVINIRPDGSFDWRDDYFFTGKIKLEVISCSGIFQSAVDGQGPCLAFSGTLNNGTVKNFRIERSNMTPNGRITPTMHLQLIDGNHTEIWSFSPD